MKFIKHLFSGIVLQGIGLSLFAQDVYKRQVENTFLPPVVITDFFLFNKRLSVDSPDSPLEKSITYARRGRCTAPAVCCSPFATPSPTESRR